MIRKSYNRPFTISIGVDTLGHTGSGYSKKDPYIGVPISQFALKNLDYGSVVEGKFYPRLAYSRSSYCHTVNPLTDRTGWTDGDIVDDFIPKEYEYEYEIQVRRNSSIGGRNSNGHCDFRRVVKRVPYTIKYKVHN